MRELGATIDTGTPDIVLAAQTAFGEALAAPAAGHLGVLLQAEFDEESYLASYPDLHEGVASGFFSSGWGHFQKHGLQEGRCWLSRRDAALQKAVALPLAGDAVGAEAALDAGFAGASETAGVETMLGCPT